MKPACPFCGTEWTDAMLAELDRYSSPTSCACCGGAVEEHAREAPTEDLCCENCGRAIFLKPAL